MISLDIKKETPSSLSQVGFSAKEEKPTLSFSDLLKGVSLKSDEKLVQNGSLVLSLADGVSKGDSKLTKNDALLSLLKDNIKEKDIPKLKSDFVEVKEVVKPSKSETLQVLLKGEVSTKEIDSVKSNIKDTKIENRKSFSSLEINPKLTESMNVSDLKLLIHDAKNYLKTKIIKSDGFKRSEIKTLPKTLEGLAQVAQKYGIDVSKISIETVQSIPKVATNKQVVLDSKITLKEEVQTTVKSEELLSDDVDMKTKKVEIKDTVKIVTASLENQDIQKNISSRNIKEIHKNHENRQTQEEVTTSDKRVEISKEIKSTPLFKAQVQKEHTTEQLVHTKIATKVEQKTPKQKADETLKSLLKGDKQENTESIKLDGLNINKADSFEVKINEAKQMTKYLSQDVKQAIEDYKSPFTRVKLQLNPQKLGEVDLTIVQRGKNLHINLSSNNIAINALALNANDLKAQLTNNGINNATLNFNNNSQGENSGANQQQQQRHNEQKAQNEYNYFETQETNEEILSSLEIVVPHYA